MQNVRKNTVLFLLLMAALISRAQNPVVIEDYINAYKEMAISEMQRTGVPAAIKLAQGIHETMAGTSDLVLKSNNHFGIKCKDTWRGESVYHDDDARGECFRKYGTPEDSYRDHSNFLKGSARYASLFNLDPTDYKHWAYGLKKAGYATNPRYPQIIIRLIEEYHLQDYTMIALGKPRLNEEEIAKTAVDVSQNEIVPVVTISEKEEAVPTVIEETTKGITRPDYPRGEFKINETRVIYAEKGTSFLAIANQYEIPLARIFEFNDMGEAEMVDDNQLIYLQRKRKTGNNEFHIVEPGETLRDIAQTEAIRLETLLEYNLLKSDSKPAVGERLNLNKKAASMPALALRETYALYSPPVSQNRANGAAKEIQFRVKPKETIYSISKKYQVKIEDIVKWNGLSSYDLKTGQPLKIYK